MDERITIDGIEYRHIRVQRGASAIYRADDRYLRIGPPAVIAEQLSVHRDMERAGYPVAAILATGSYGGLDYFIERSLGEQSFRVRFTEEYGANGSLDEATVSRFIAIAERFLRAQIGTAQAPAPDSYREGTHLDVMKAELPAYAERIEARFQRSLAATAGLPYVVTHGDFNPSNMYPEGVIDIEDSFRAPLGYDLVTALYTIDWFPDSPEYEYVAQYRFGTPDKERFLAMCDRVLIEHGLPALTPRYDDFAFARAAWMTARMHQWPKIQAWRYQKFISSHLS